MKECNASKSKSLFYSHTYDSGAPVVAYLHFGDYPYLHNHDYWEFVLVTEGSYEHYLNNTPYVLQKHSACLLRPSIDFHKLKNLTDSTCHIVLRILDEPLRKLCDFLSPSLYDELLAKKSINITFESAQTKKMLDGISKIKIAPPPEQMYIFNYLLMFVIEIIFSNNYLINENKPAWFTNLLIQISSPKNIDWTVDDVLQNTHYSHTSLLRYFKEYENTSIVGYLTRIKMLHAHDFLIYTEMSVLDIAYKLGFSDSSHFNRVFKKFYGVSPTRYKALKSTPPRKRVKLK